MVNLIKFKKISGKPELRKQKKIVEKYKKILRFENTTIMYRLFSIH